MVTFCNILSYTIKWRCIADAFIHTHIYSDLRKRKNNKTEQFKPSRLSVVKNSAFRGVRYQSRLISAVSFGGKYEYGRTQRCTVEGEGNIHSFC